MKYVHSVKAIMSIDQLHYKTCEKLNSSIERIANEGLDLYDNRYGQDP